MPSEQFDKRSGAATPRTTALGHPKGDLWLLLAGLPVLGLLVGLALPRLARWVSGSPVLPWRDGIAFVGRLDAPWQTGLVMAAGLVAGLALAFTAIAEAMRLELTDDQVRIEQHDTVRVLERADVSAVFRDGKHLVILGRDSAELARGEHGASAAALADAFRAHGYPWRDADPHAALFRRWIPGAPGLPAEVHALLKAREAAMKRDSGRDARDLAEAVREAGFVVRDEKGEQYWRPLAGGGGA
ncbi:hypothetical protein DCW30_31740 [Streptomyces alfalfae]|uniref:ABC transporter permease n=2 Tax=Streptomyces alfalfae TaxID=1642299 RepID=A0ABM6GYG8_9ACTN|nr:hypothetical protein [Streptomyces alfalfae]APY88593.1 hypothetical protein A7J05_25515 [Streptomyces alfalfae]AYA19007.1 hypothetical protein D3X13_24675 [Streptomyces fradiae]RXX36480.1 hypothetical protein DCW30_31740 [Streptomyces alfalfae]RZM90395.1 hypothetical protein D4104_24725 [Streptomyces alfalfae]